MQKSSSWPRLLAATLGLAILFAVEASAQQPPTVRIRGTIEAVDGPMLSIKSREGTDLKVKMTDNVAVFAVVKTELSEIKEGSYIGVTGMPEPDGTQRAVAVHIFPENQRGAAEGFRPWDARPNSTISLCPSASRRCTSSMTKVGVKSRARASPDRCARERASINENAKPPPMDSPPERPDARSHFPFRRASMVRSMYVR